MAVDDLFGDDAQVTIASRPSAKRSIDQAALDEYDVDAATIARRDASRGQKRTANANASRSAAAGSAGGAGGEEFAFDYLPAYDPSQSATAAASRRAANGGGVQPSASSSARGGGGGGGGRGEKRKEAFDLGLDDEVEIRAKPARAPIPKLDDDRLMDAEIGLPRFQAHYAGRIAAHCRRLRARPAPTASSAARRGGVAEEYSDLVRVMEEYQMWMHGLFSKAKFRDCIKLVRKAGKTGRIRAHRRGMIDALIKPASPAARDEGEAAAAEHRISQTVPAPVASATAPADTIPAARETQEPDMPDDADMMPPDDGDDDDDDMDALEAMGWA